MKQLSTAISHNTRGYLHACHFYLYTKGAFVEERLWQLGIQALLLLGVATLQSDAFIPITGIHSTLFTALGASVFQLFIITSPLLHEQTAIHPSRQQHWSQGRH